ncbi:glycerol-3-phosphate 1-O-acyltransferase [Endozoicomonas sp. OPT23]|uniref:glycerol-3-phosphate 1-O-acyltransferase PlsB n=1 Tax=Endozoicomonas sp. OPT23 TaxID=2072845 RepID=UPI00129BAF4D|nr:glycerol-3-phosphate 1-O-acyltransferase PlsB [Endozoicomonas sp. OPT23]MRI31976.1 glycerol-3-phosphate 1-O-acyltransferase [Endozoicomonas sp. OPT23]
MHKPNSLKRFLFHSLRKLLFTWVRTTVKNNDAESLGLQSDKPVCYVLRNRSYSDLMVVEQECRRAGLPRPYAFIHQDKKEGSQAFFYLTHQRGVILQREHPGTTTTLKHLIQESEENPELDVQLVPVSIFWGRTPEKEQSALKLLFDWNFSLGGRFSKFMAILLHGRQTMVHFNPAMSLREMVDESQDSSRTLRKVGRVLRVHFRQLRESVIGPDQSHRRILVNGLIHTPQMRKAIEAEASAREITLVEAEQKARKYANEIASDYSYPVVRFMDILLTWFWNKLYNGVSINNIDQVKELSQKNSIIYVPCHRSHIDYLLLSYVLYYEGLTPPHIAAGINLNMPVVGSILRKGGAFFMRRTFRGNPLYSAVFHEYLYSLSSRGFPIEYFVEGGRSRTGRTLNPKAGMISLSLRSFLRNNRKPVVFVPVYIGYEKLLEVNTYMSELRGKSKKKESPLDIFKTFSALKDEFGKAWINFGDPINMGDFLDQQAPQWRDTDISDGHKPDWLKKTTSNLAFGIASGINSAAVINPVNLVSMALLSAPRHALGEHELVLLLDTYRSLLARAPYSDSTVMTDLDGYGMVKYVENLDVLHKTSDSLGDVYSLDEKTAIVMTYYRNNVLHMFAVPSLLSCLFVNNSKLSQRDIYRVCSILYPYLKSELFLKWSNHGFIKVVKQWLNAMVEEGLVIKTEDGYYQPPEHSSSQYVVLTVLSRAISQTLERFYTVISLLISNGSGFIEQETLEKQSRDLAQRLSIIHGLNAPEFFDKNLFKGFIEQLRQNDIIDISLTNKLNFGEEVKMVADEAFKVLTSEVRHSILQATHSQPTPIEEPQSI